MDDFGAGEGEIVKEYGWRWYGSHFRMSFLLYGIPALTGVDSVHHLTLLTFGWID